MSEQSKLYPSNPPSPVPNSGLIYCRAASSLLTPSPAAPAFVRICFVGWKPEDCRIAKKILRDG